MAETTSMTYVIWEIQFNHLLDSQCNKCEYLFAMIFGKMGYYNFTPLSIYYLFSKILMTLSLPHVFLTPYYWMFMILLGIILVVISEPIYAKNLSFL